MALKKEIRKIEDDSGVLIFDETAQEKAHSKENDLIFWHFDHVVNRSVKGINLLNCLYYADNVSLPVAFEVVTKPIRFCDISTKKEKRKSEVTKNELLRSMLLSGRALFRLVFATNLRPFVIHDNLTKATHIY